MHGGIVRSARAGKAVRNIDIFIVNLELTPRSPGSTARTASQNTAEKIADANALHEWDNKNIATILSFGRE